MRQRAEHHPIEVKAAALSLRDRRYLGECTRCRFFRRALEALDSIVFQRRRSPIRSAAYEHGSPRSGIRLSPGRSETASALKRSWYGPRPVNVHVSVASDGLLPQTLQQRRTQGRSVRWLVACHARRRQNGSMPELLSIIARHPVVTFMIIGLGDLTGHLRLASARSTGQWLAASASRGGCRFHPPAGAPSAC